MGWPAYTLLDPTIHRTLKTVKVCNLSDVKFVTHFILVYSITIYEINILNFEKCWFSLVKREKRVVESIYNDSGKFVL